MSQSIAVSSPAIRAAKAAATIVLGVAFITLCAKLRIPSWPVPMTLQTLAVMTLAIMAPRLAAATFFSYLVAGAAGLPVFAGTPERGIGLAYMAGPTGGYLLGYLCGIALTARLARGRGLVMRVFAMLAGLAVTYALGLLWLGTYAPANKIIALGFMPFILSDLVSIGIVAVASTLMPARLLGAIGR